MNFHLWLIADPAYWYQSDLPYLVMCLYLTEDTLACINLVTVIKSNDLLMKFWQKTSSLVCHVSACLFFFRQDQIELSVH